MDDLTKITGLSIVCLNTRAFRETGAPFLMHVLRSH